MLSNVKGQLHITRFNYPGRALSRRFVKPVALRCHLNPKTVNTYLACRQFIEEPSKELDAQIFCEEQTEWQKRIKWQKADWFWSRD